ncbi:DNA replication initiation control protein YabA [Brevibacillus marinus]|uniref:DNA replication initiation control protein YabA n=1 Tax=Brevibacillus marinus TaxID=2496837 RepID=UPI000F818F84|nr:DNA replication initiation control protein YabA [Brevibacillus marinus]
MDKREIFEKMASIEERIGELYQEVGELKNVIVALIEENGQLQLENELLRNRLHGKSIRPIPKPPALTDLNRTKKATEGKGKAVVGEGYDNLARLYAEGFHICNIHYGSLRKEGDCLFCLSFLSGVMQK